MAKAKEKRLAKGLSSIFGEDIDAVLSDIDKGEGIAKGNAITLKVSDIRPNPYQPRKTFDEVALRELADSIKEHGVFQPVLVRKAVKGYELIAGERRLRATKLNKMTEIPAIILDFDDTAMMEVSLLENIQREDLSVIEEAKAYDQLIRRLDYTQEELANRVGKSRSHITNVLRLLKLPESVSRLTDEGKISFGHARALLSLESEERMEEVAEKIVKEGLSVRDTEKIVNRKPGVKSVPVQDPYLAGVRNTLQSKLGTSVEVTGSKITISYKGTDDLNRILEIMDALEEN